MRAIGSRGTLIWLSIAAVLVVPISAAAYSPLLAWRDPVYIVAGFAGILAMALLFVQPLLAMGDLPGLHVRRSRHIHQIVGGLLVASVFIHVIGLYFTSPPDVIDVLLFRSPTPFSIWGMIGLIGVVLSTLLALFRRSLRLRPLTWRVTHVGLSITIVLGTIIHAWMIQGTMEPISKAALSFLIIAATVWVLRGLIPMRR